MYEGGNNVPGWVAILSPCPGAQRRPTHTPLNGSIAFSSTNNNNNIKKKKKKKSKPRPSNNKFSIKTVDYSDWLDRQSDSLSIIDSCTDSQIWI